MVELSGVELSQGDNVISLPREGAVHVLLDTGATGIFLPILAVFKGRFGFFGFFFFFFFFFQSLIVIYSLWVQGLSAAQPFWQTPLYGTQSFIFLLVSL